MRRTKPWELVGWAREEAGWGGRCGGLPARDLGPAILAEGPCRTASLCALQVRYPSP